MGTQTTAAPRGASGQTPTSMANFVPFVVICFILYFLLFRPQQKQAKEHKELMENLKTGDRVLTQGGIYGTVSGIKDGIVTVKVAENVRMDFTRNSITQVIKDVKEPAIAVVDPNA